MKEAKKKAITDAFEKTLRFLRENAPAEKMLHNILQSGKPLDEIRKDIEMSKKDLRELVRNTHDLKKIIDRGNRHAVAEQILKNIQGIFDKYNICEGGNRDRGN